MVSLSTAWELQEACTASLRRPVATIPDFELLDSARGRRREPMHLGGAPAEVP